MKSIKYLSIVLILLIIGLVIINIYYKNKSFNKPGFEKNIEIVDIEEYESKSLSVVDGYKFFVTHTPTIEDNYMYIDFVSLTNENIYLKLRVLQDDNVIGETGLIKKGERIEKIKINDELIKKDFVFVIMSYEKDTYKSLGEVKLRVRVG